jgi:UDP-glucose 4-epimerase
LNNKNTIFFIVRAWNIFWSNWSVVKLFYNQIRNNVPLTITDYDMKRFYISVEEIVNLIIFWFYNSVWWEVFIPRCHVLSLKQILDTIITLYWNWKENIKQIWKRKWEKINEILISNNEIENTYIANDNYFIIDCLNKNLVKKEKVNFYEYSTKDFSWNIDYKKIKEIISNIFN